VVCAPLEEKKDNAHLIACVFSAATVDSFHRHDLSGTIRGVTHNTGVIWQKEISSEQKLARVQS
jgi:hypothetical protein